MKLLKFLPLLILTGCIHINSGTANADREQIEAHLKNQLHCRTLELRENNPDSFTGIGKNDTGDFTINVARKEDLLTFHGAYTDPGKGTFNGSASWSTKINSTIGYHSSNESSKNSLGTP